MGELRGHASSATHRQTGWGLHQRRWSNDACATPQRRPHHELAWIWADFLSEQRRVTAFVETAGGWVANESLLNARARLNILGLFCERYWLAGMWCLCHVSWHTLFLITVLELIGFVRFQFVSHEVCSDEGLVIWHFLFYVFTNCIVVITEYLNSNHFKYQWIGKPNKKSNALQIKKFMTKNALKANFFCEKNALQAKLMWEIASEAIFCDRIMMGTLSC